MYTMQLDEEAGLPRAALVFHPDIRVRVLAKLNLAARWRAGSSTKVEKAATQLLVGFSTILDRYGIPSTFITPDVMATILGIADNECGLRPVRECDGAFIPVKSLTTLDTLRTTYVATANQRKRIAAYCGAGSAATHPKVDYSGILGNDRLDLTSNGDPMGVADYQRDGCKFRGSGFIQITGEDNHRLHVVPAIAYLVQRGVWGKRGVNLRSVVPIQDYVAIADSAIDVFSSLGSGLIMLKSVPDLSAHTSTDFWDYVGRHPVLMFLAMLSFLGIIKWQSVQGKPLAITAGRRANKSQSPQAIANAVAGVNYGPKYFKTLISPKLNVNANG